MTSTSSCDAPHGLEDKGGDTKVRAPRAALSMADFEIEKVLGAGSFAQVLQAKLTRSGQTYALKIMDKRHIVKEGKAEYVLRERRILDALKYDGLVNLCFTFQDPHSLYLGLELCTKVGVDAARLARGDGSLPLPNPPSVPPGGEDGGPARVEPLSALT